MAEYNYDVVVVGAGAAGLIAAWEIALTGKSVAVIEAKDRAGGRIHTIPAGDFSVPIEAGAEFVHGKLPVTQMLAKRAGIELHAVKGSIWQKTGEGFQKQSDFIEDFKDLEKKFKELKEDMSVAQFIDNYLQGDAYEELRFTLKNYVEGYYAADTEKASAMALCNELMNSDDEQFRVEGGYDEIIDYLEGECKSAGVIFFMQDVVHTIEWKENEVTVKAITNTLHGRKCMVTVPVGVLQSGSITFSPSIDAQMDAIQQLGYGPVIKIILEFEDAFWANKELTNNKSLRDLGFLFSTEEIPTWWTQWPRQQPILTGWLGGPNAERMKDEPEEEVLTRALYALTHLFNMDIISLQQKLKAHYIFNWTKDPYTCGAYSYEVVNGNSLIAQLLQPVGNTIYFAGEGYHKGAEIGTVEGALVSGRDTAHRLVADF